jgi:hypothetical protein
MDSIKKICYLVLIFLFLIIGSDFHIFAQSGLQMSVSGYVRDVNSNMPIAGLEVLIFNLEQESRIKVFKGTTNVNGFYKVRFLNAGKYQFSINKPKIGIIHIDAIAQGGEVGNPYSFEIIEGVNKRLNIFMGENNFPYIKVDTSEYSGEINFTMLYMKRQVEIKSIRSSAPVITKECDGLTWIFKTEEIEVPDDYQLIYPPPKDGSTDFGSFHFQYNFFTFEYSCENDKCKYTDFRLEVDSCILVQSVNFYMEKYKFTEDCAKCFRKCTLYHENAHANSFFPIACEEWINFLNKFDSIPCCKDKDCTDTFYEYLSEFKKKIKSELEKEHDTLKVKDRECQSKCLKGCI